MAGAFVLMFLYLSSIILICARSKKKKKSGKLVGGHIRGAFKQP
jgi:hypothetical protein